MLAHMHQMVVPKPCPVPILAEFNDPSSAHLADPSLTDFPFKQSQATADDAYHSVLLASEATAPESPLFTASDLNPLGLVEHLVSSTYLTVHGNSLLSSSVLWTCSLSTQQS